MKAYILIGDDEVLLPSVKLFKLTKFNNHKIDGNLVTIFAEDDNGDNFKIEITIQELIDNLPTTIYY